VGEIEPLAEGRAWMGLQAKRNGLIDELGGLDRAIELVRQKAGIPAGDKVQIVLYPKRRSLIEQLMKSSEESTVEVLAWRRLHEMLRKAGLDAGMDALLTEGYLKIAPYQIRFR
ncbi:MAG: S49 family peptidase, partial [Bryobacterales bacterium]|nr:S49 family peptidase [Bryobacterales bacterium]